MEKSGVITNMGDATQVSGEKSILNANANANANGGVDLYSSILLKRAHDVKEEGNTRFQDGDYVGALERYDYALRLIPETNPDKAVFHSNRAACLMQMNPIDYESVIAECSVALQVQPCFVRALLQRARAFEVIGKKEMAMQDVQMLLGTDPNHLEALEIARRLVTDLVPRQETQQDVQSSPSPPALGASAVRGTGEKQISLKLMVDKLNNRVVFAESDGDFVDILFSFLTMPMGTIIRLLNNQSQPVTIGSFTSLYQGVVDFSAENLWTECCKSMLLHPKNSAATLVQNLKLNIDDTESTRSLAKKKKESTRRGRPLGNATKAALDPTPATFVPSSRRAPIFVPPFIHGQKGYQKIFPSPNTKSLWVSALGTQTPRVGPATRYFASSNLCCHLSTLKDITCPCRNSINKEILCEDSSSANFRTSGLGGVFVKAGAMFVISDDFQVMPASYDAIISLLNNHGIKDMQGLLQKTLNVGLEEIYRILALSFLSKSTLTDMFLGCQGTNSNCPNFGSIKSKEKLETNTKARKIIVKLIVQKVDNKVLYAESTEDFIDLLFSLLTVPLGSMEELLGGHSSLKCVDNLYKSVGDLNVDRFMGSNNLKEMLLSPKLPLGYLCKNQVLDVKEVTVKPQLCIKKNDDARGRVEYKKSLTYTGQCPLGYTLKPSIFLDPKASDGNTASNQGYVKGPATFMVTDDLVVTPLSSISSICLLKSLNADINSLEKRVISVGEEEALSLLKASLCSSSALTIGLNSFQKPKQESCISWLKILSKWNNVKN